MINKILSIAGLLLFLMAPPAEARGILVVQSLQIKPYNEALQGFTSVCTAKTSKQISTKLSKASIVRIAQNTKPDLILAIGMDALEKVKDVRNVPIVYLMVLNPQNIVHNNDNITGVSLNIMPDNQLSVLRQALPHARKVGLLYDPDKSGAFVRKARNAARKLGFELLSKKVQSPSEAAAALDSMKGEIDAFWMLPDTTVVTPKTIDLLMLSAIENRIPVYTFSDKYAEKGALLALEVDAVEAGKQAGEAANMILAGADAHSITQADAQSGTLTINLIVAKKLGIPISSTMLTGARVLR